MIRPGLAALAAGFVLAVLPGCAGRIPQPARLDLRSLAARHDRLLEARRTRIPGTLAELSLWLETPAGRYPGTRATYLLAGPDTLRLRIASSFGTAVDAAGAGDRLLVWVPSRNTVVRADAGAPPIGLPGAAAFGVRIAAATWAVPADAWRGARTADTLTVVRWEEAGDTLEVEIGGSGLPRRAQLSRPGMPGLVVTYLDYGWAGGTPWPERFDVEDGAGTMRLSVRVRRVTDASGGAGARWRPDVPDDAETASAEELWRWIEEEWSP